MISGRKESATAGGGFCWLGTLGVTWGVWDPLRLHMLSTPGPPGDQDIEQEMRAAPHLANHRTQTAAPPGSPPTSDWVGAQEASPMQD